MAAKFQFSPISVKTVSLTKNTTIYIIKERKILYKKCSMYQFAMSDNYTDIQMFYLLFGLVQVQR